MKISLKPSVNWLFVFIPITVILERAGELPAPLIFFSAALAIIPLAAWIVRGTENLAVHTGDAIGGLLNATFGNAPELIVAMVALRAGYPDMVRASLIGAILANLLLVLGLSFFLGGLRHHTQEYAPKATRSYSTMMLIAVISLGVPSAFSRFFAPDSTVRAETMLNVGTAFILLIAYALYLVFLLVTHPDEFKSDVAQEGEAHHEGVWSVGRAVSVLFGASVLAAWMSEILVGAAEETGKALGMSQTFIGIVFLALVGAASAMAGGVSMAKKNKVDLTMGIALGSSIQIALFVAPVLVLSSFFVAPEPLELSFHRSELGSLFFAVLIGAFVCGDGRSNWYRGVQLIAVYLIVALMFYFIPDPA